MLCYKDDTLSLLPWCFDRIKAWTRKRQQYKYFLDYVERRQHSNKYLDIVERAFNKMKNADYDRIKQLEKVEFERLGKLQIDNYQRLCENEKKLKKGAKEEKAYTH